MPRTARQTPAGFVYHALNRAIRRLKLFRKAADYRAFLGVFDEALERHPIRVLGYCIMPTHWHVVLWPAADGELSSFLRRLTLTHSVRWHRHYQTTGSGHVYQARFKAFAVAKDEHLLTVLRYVERNPCAGLVRRAEDWPWSSLACRLAGGEVAQRRFASLAHRREDGLAPVGERGPNGSGTGSVAPVGGARPAFWSGGVGASGGGVPGFRVHHPATRSATQAASRCVGRRLIVRCVPFVSRCQRVRLAMKRKRCPRCSEFMDLVDTPRGRVYSCVCGKLIRVQVKQTAVAETEPEPEPDEAPEIALPVRKSLRRKSLKRRPEENVFLGYWNYFNDTFGAAGFVMLGLVAVWLFGLMGTCLLPPGMFLLIGLGIMTYYGGYIWLVVIGFRDSPLAGFLLLAGAFIPIVGLLGLIYAIMNIGETWKALLFKLIGILMIVSAIMAAILSPMHLLHR